MIELRYSPCGMLFQMDPEQPTLRFKKPSAPKASAPPPLPPPVAKQTEIIEKAGKVGEETGRRLRKKTGRRASRISRPDLASVPANVARAGLKTELG